MPGAPAGHLLVGDNGGPADEGLRLVVQMNALGDDEPDARPVTIVLHHQSQGIPKEPDRGPVSGATTTPVRVRARTGRDPGRGPLR